jgi:hypothetical protein
MFLLAPIVFEVNGCLKSINEHSCGSSAAKVQILFATLVCELIILLGI